MPEKIPILLVNITMRFPTKHKRKYTFKTYEKKVTKGLTPIQAFRFIRVPDKDLCDMYCIEAIKKVGETKIIDN